MFGRSAEPAQPTTPFIVAQEQRPPVAPRPPTGFSRYQEQKRDANENTVSIMGSQASSAYTKMAEDMQSILDKPDGGLRVLPILGRGGGQNFQDMLFLKGVDMGLVEQDVIRVFKKKDPLLYSNVEQRIQYITKLANSELHVFARHEIKTLADLAGKKMSWYKKDSSSAMAAQTLFGACGIDVDEQYLDQELAHEQLKSGELAAVTRISGAPHDAFAKYKPEDGHFLQLDAESLPAGCYEKLMETYLPAELKPTHYPALIKPGENVQTVANATLLAAYAWPENTERYNRVAKFIKAFFDSIDEFRKPPRHPKWTEINLAADMPGWVRYKPAQQWLDANRVGSAPQPADTQAAFSRFLDDYAKTSGNAQLTSAQRDALFAQFSKWWTTQQAQR